MPHPLSHPWARSQYYQGQELLPEDNAQQVLLERTVLRCFCRGLSVAAAAKLTEAAQPALELRLASPEAPGKEKRLAFATWALLHHILHPPGRQTCQSSEHLQTLPMTLFLTLSLYFPLIVCSLPYQTLLTALASNYKLLGLSAQQAERTKSLINAYSCKLLAAKSLCHTHNVFQTPRKMHFRPLFLSYPALRRKKLLVFVQA